MKQFDEWWESYIEICGNNPEYQPIDRTSAADGYRAGMLAAAGMLEEYSYGPYEHPAVTIRKAADE